MFSLFEVFFLLEQRKCTVFERRGWHSLSVVINFWHSHKSDSDFPHSMRPSCSSYYANILATVLTLLLNELWVCVHVCNTTKYLISFINEVLHILEMLNLTAMHTASFMSKRHNKNSDMKYFFRQKQVFQHPNNICERTYISWQRKKICKC